MHIDLEERLPNFDKSIDIALGFSLPTPHYYDDIIQVPMGTTRYLCGSPDYFVKNGEPKIDDLQDHLFISHPSREQQHLKFANHQAINVKPTLYVNQ